jgi:hypothetical protein
MLKSVSVTVLIALLLTVFTSCTVKNPFKKEEVIPETVTVKTDLHDPSYTFTYGELKKVIPLEKLAALFENYQEKNPDTEITLSHNEIVSRFNAGVMKDNGETLEGIWALATDEEIKATTANKNEVVDYFNKHVNALKTQKPKTEFYESFWTDDSTDSVHFTRNGVEFESGSDEYKALAATFKVFKNYAIDGAKSRMLGNIDGQKNPTDEGDSLDDILYLWGEKDVSRLTPDDLQTAISSLKYDYTLVNKENYVTGITRTVVLTLQPGGEAASKAFSLHDKAPILEEMKKAKDLFTVEDYDVTFGECVITAVFDAATDEILNLTYTNNMTIRTEITGVNKFASVGTIGIQFNCTDEMWYHFGWHTSEG